MHLIEEGRAAGTAGARAYEPQQRTAISIAISILFPLTWQWRSIIDCNIERHVFPITAPVLSISLRRRRRRRRPYRAYEFILHVCLFPRASAFPIVPSAIIIAKIGEAVTGHVERRRNMTLPSYFVASRVSRVNPFRRHAFERSRVFKSERFHRPQFFRRCIGDTLDRKNCR